MFYSDLVKKACLISFDAHKNDSDKGGYPYVYHPFFLASQFDDEKCVCVALLHDLIEDHGDRFSFESLKREGFDDDIIDALKLLTHEHGTDYMEYVKKIAVNSIARKVKMADLKHNMDSRRTGGQAPRKIELYQKAYRYLESCTPKKYPQFGQIIETMNSAHYDYKKDWIVVKESYTMNEHIGGMIYAQLSNQRPWKPIAEHFADIDAIFHNFDPEYLKSADPAELEAKIRAIRCGNRQIHKQMLFLKENIEMLERIEKENGSIDAYLRNTKREELVQSLSCGKYKLKQMGTALVSEYLKGKGVELVKPDVHVCRILGRLGFTEHSPATKEEAFNVCHEIALEYGMRDAEVDSVLWQFGADQYFEICTSTQKCEKCLVQNCGNRIST